MCRTLTAREVAWLAKTRQTVARLTPSAVAIVLAGSPLACIRCANALSIRPAPWGIRRIDRVPDERLAQLPCVRGPTPTRTRKAEWPRAHLEVASGQHVWN